MISFLNKYGEDIGTRDFIEVQWTRRWSEAGEFTVYMAAKDYDPEIKYVINSGRPETGMVMKVEYEENEAGESITLSGFFLEKVADFGQIIFNYEYKFSSGAKLFQDLMIKAYRSHNDGGGKPFAYNLYEWQIDSDSEFPPTGYDGNIQKGTPAGEAIYSILASDGYSFLCKPIWAPKSVEATMPLIGLNFIFKKPRDLTNEVFFGRQFNNVTNVHYTLDESKMKPQYVISQEGLTDTGKLTDWTGNGKFYSIDIEWVDGNENIIGRSNYTDEGNRPSDIGYCLPMKAYTTNVDGIELVPTNAVTIVSQMNKQAQMDMLNNYKIEEIEVTVIQERFYYLKDYDLGDRCTVVVDALHQMYVVRIEEIREIHRNNMVEIELVFGTPRKVKWREIR